MSLSYDSDTILRNSIPIWHGQTPVIPPLNLVCSHIPQLFHKLKDECIAASWCLSPRFPNPSQTAMWFYTLKRFPPIFQNLH